MTPLTDHIFSAGPPLWSQIFLNAPPLKSHQPPPTLWRMNRPLYLTIWFKLFSNDSKEKKWKNLANLTLDFYRLLGSWFQGHDGELIFPKKRLKIEPWQTFVNVLRHVCWRALMLNDPKVKISSELSRKSSANFANFLKKSKNAPERSYGLRTTLGREISGNLRSWNNKMFLEREKRCSKDEGLSKSCHASFGQP